MNTKEKTMEQESHISVIQPEMRETKKGIAASREEAIRVAAYCRVSTGDESQKTSYTMQKAFYTNLISSRPNWIMAGIFADEDRSGTSIKGREGFLAMMEAARAGKIDYIITKSISRFARNTVTTLESVHELQQMNPPVGILFEKERVDTLTLASEIILTIWSSLAQAESESIGKNIDWGIRNAFKNGAVFGNLNRMLGYDYGEDGTWVINEEQARTVRYIFQNFLAGKSGGRIARELNDKHWYTVLGNPWRSDAVYRILRNEKYMGDAISQKTVTESYLTHKSIPNDGIAEKYYNHEHHEPIVKAEDWQRVQKILNNRSRTKKGEAKTKKLKRGAKSSPFAILTCGGKPMSRMTYNKTALHYKDARSADCDSGKYLETYFFAEPVWKCKGQEKAVLYEKVIRQRFMEMLYQLKVDYERNGEESGLWHSFRSACIATSREKTEGYMVHKLEFLELQIQELEAQYRDSLSLKGNPFHAYYMEREAESDFYGKHSQEIKTQLDNLKKVKEELEKERGAILDMKRNFNDFLKLLDTLSPLQTERDSTTSATSEPFPPSGSPEPSEALKSDRKETEYYAEDYKEYYAFRQDIFTLFITSAKAEGGTIRYGTNFGLEFITEGNDAAPETLLGSRIRKDGEVKKAEYLWQLHEGKIYYKRRRRKGGNISHSGVDR